MKKILSLLALVLMSCMGAWADGPFTFTSWVYNSYTRVGGTEGNATYHVNPAMCLEQQGVNITNAGDLTVTFTYTSGDLRLEIYGVDLVNESTSEVAKSNYTFKYAGGDKQGQVYTLSGVETGTYTMRFWSSVWGSGNQLFGGSKDSNGNITYGGDAATGVTFAATTWATANDSWKEVAAVPADVKTLINTQNFKSYNNIHYHDDANLTFSEAKTYNINYNYTGANGGGNERMDIRGVEVLDANGNVVAHDYHEGFTGSQASNRDYKVAIPAGTYTVRTLVQTANANDVRCKGNITYTVIDGSAMATNYNTNIKPNLYDNGVLKIGAPAQSLLTALETAITGGNDIAIEAAYNAAMTTNNLNLPTGYYYFRSIANDRNEPYLYNNYFLNNNNQHHTLQSNSKVTTNAGIWYVQNNGTSISIKNGDGQPLVQGNQEQGNAGGVTVRNSLNFGSFNVTNFKNWGYKGIYFTEGLNAANTNTYSVNNSVDTRFVTTWANQSDKKDDNWTFEPVENPNIYNVSITGAEGYVTLKSTNEYAYNGGFFNAASITNDDLTAQTIAGYTPNIEVNGSTITVTYTYSDNHPYLVFKCNRDASKNGLSANANGSISTPSYNESSANQKFLLVNIEGKDYLYNKAVNKFITSPASGKIFVLVDYPHHAYTTTPATTPNGVYTTIVKINGATVNNNNYGSLVNSWETQDDGNKFQINQVGGISDAEYDALVASVKAACDAKKADMKTKNDAYSTTRLNAYSWANLDNTTAAVTASQALDTEAADYYTSLFAEIRKFDINYVPVINQPKAGSFLRIRNAGGSNKRISCVNQAGGTKLQCANDLNDDKIFFYDGTHLLAYKTGMYVGVSSDNFLTNCTDVNNNIGTTITFPGSPVKSGTYNVVFNGNRYLHDDGNAGANAANSTDAKYTFWLEEVTELPVTIASSGYTTFYAPVDIMVPASTTAYAATVDAEETTITYSPYENNIIPASHGAMLKGTPGANINLVPSTGAVDKETHLVGHQSTCAVSQSGVMFIYTLQSGMFQYFTGSQIPGFKAYLCLTRDHRASAGGSNLRVVFEDGFTTGIEAVESNAKNEIFDLQGRRVNTARNGLYIVNGKKVIR